MSFGLSACGYDVRIDLNNKPFGRWLIEPGQFLLASTLEEFDMPTSLVGIVHDKSTWARQGLTVQNTVIEPGWKGFLTLELTNHGTEGLWLEDADPIAQIVFHLLDHPTDQPYNGKYQNQEKGPQEARFD
jgi:dCTP deaminase